MSEWWKEFFDSPWPEFQRALKREDTEADLRFVAAALEITGSEHVLDAPCGDGRLAVGLAVLGSRVAAVDNQPLLIELAQTRAPRGLAIEWLCADVRSLRYDQQFDCAICFWGSFGYFGDNENAAMLRMFAQALRAGGRLLLETHCIETVLPTFSARDWRMAGPFVLLEERSWDHFSGLLHNTWTYVLSDGSRVQRRSSIRLYSLATLVTMVREAGFERVSILGSERGYLGPRTCILAQRGSDR